MSEDSRDVDQQELTEDLEPTDEEAEEIKGGRTRPNFLIEF